MKAKAKRAETKTYSCSHCSIHIENMHTNTVNQRAKKDQIANSLEIPRELPVPLQTKSNQFQILIRPFWWEDIPWSICWVFRKRERVRWDREREGGLKCKEKVGGNLQWKINRTVWCWYQPMRDGHVSVGDAASGTSLHHRFGRSCHRMPCRRRG